MFLSESCRGTRSIICSSSTIAPTENRAARRRAADRDGAWGTKGEIVDQKKAAGKSSLNQLANWLSSFCFFPPASTPKRFRRQRSTEGFRISVLKIVASMFPYGDGRPGPVALSTRIWQPQLILERSTKTSVTTPISNMNFSSARKLTSGAKDL